MEEYPFKQLYYSLCSLQNNTLQRIVKNVIVELKNRTGFQASGPESFKLRRVTTEHLCLIISNLQ